MKLLTQIGGTLALALALTVSAQEAPPGVVPAIPIPAQEAPAPIEQQTPVPSVDRGPSRANNFHFPRVVKYNGEEVTEGFWVIMLCGKPVVFVYDAEGQMSVPLFGPVLLSVAAERAWDLEDGPRLLPIPDLADIYPPIRNVCDDLARADRKIQHDNEKVAPPATKMK